MTTLDLSACGLITLDNTILPNGIETIILGENMLESIDNVVWPSTLVKLSIRGNNLVIVPLLPSTLKILELDGNQIRDLYGFDTLVNLVELWIGWNKISILQRFPPNLKILSLWANNIATLEDAQFPLGLKVLDISANLFRTLEGVKFPLGLTCLNVSEMNLNTLSGFDIPPILEDLNLSLCRFTTLDEFNPPESLTRLNLSDNDFDPGALARFKFPSKIETLFLCNIGITSLAGISLPPRLIELWIGRNFLTDISHLLVYIYTSMDIKTVDMHGYDIVPQDVQEKVNRALEYMVQARPHIQALWALSEKIPRDLKYMIQDFLTQ